MDLRPTEVINLRICGLMVKATESKSLCFFQSLCRHVCTSTGKPMLIYLCPPREVIMEFAEMRKLHVIDISCSHKTLNSFTGEGTQ